MISGGRYQDGGGRDQDGALDFIEKPFRGSEIVARLNEAIDAYARRQAEGSASKTIAAFSGARTADAA